MREPLVSVLMVNFNHEETIQEAIESVLGQTYRNIQFIIVDDGSTDHSCDVIRSFQDERIELYCLESNRHICYATNYGFEKVKGDYLARIDSDDVWYPDKLSRQIEFLQKSEQYQICFSWIDLIDANGTNINEDHGELLHLFETEFVGQEDCLLTFFVIGNCLSHPSVLMETEVLNTIGGFNPGYMQSHDFDYWIRTAKKYPIYVMKERLLAMRRFNDKNKLQNNSNVSDISTLRFYNEYLDIRKHFFDGMSNELFRKTFRNEFKNKDAQSYAELECEKAFLLCRPIHGTEAIPPSGIEKILEIFAVPDVKFVLEQKYGFYEKDFYELTGTHIYYDRILQEKEITLNQQHEAEKTRRIEAEERIRELEREEKQLIRMYEGSTSWKMTAPLRWSARKIKGRKG